MKRNVTASGGAVIRSPLAPKSQTHELDRVIAYMISEITERYKNNVILGLHKSTIAKFSDAQTGNYAKVVTMLANKTNRRLMKQFANKRIDKMVNNVLNKVNTRNQQQLYDLVERRIGIPSSELIATEGLKANINALMLETSAWVKKLRDNTLAEYSANTLRAMAVGGSLEDVMKNFEGVVEKRKNHARFIARNQIANFNTITGKIRAQNLGITEGIWRTSEDERVRHSHAVRDGKKFDVSKGLYSSTDGKSLLPGIDYQCRCYTEYVIPED